MIKKTIYYLFIFLFFFLPIFFVPWTSELFEFNKTILVYFATILITSLWILQMIFEKRFIFNKTPLDLPLIFFLATQFISTLFSIDTHTSIFGYYSRFNGGLLSHISYALLYWSFVSNIEKNQVFHLIKTLFVSTFIVSLYAISEHFGKSPSCLLISGKFNTNCWVQDVQERVFATFGQPNWLAAWLVTIMPLTWISNINFLLSPIFFTALIFTKSRSALLGFTIGNILFWLIILTRKFNFEKKLFRTFFIFYSFILIISLTFGTPWTPKLSKIFTGEKSIPATIKEEGGTESGEIRKIVWQGGLKLWQRYPVVGTGPETFAYSYYKFRPKEHNLVSEWNFLFNKAHNEYINFAATTGTLGLVSYIFLIFASIKQIMKNSANQNSNESSLLHYSLASGLFALYISNFFGFSVTSTNLLLFLFPAISISLNMKGGSFVKPPNANIYQKISAITVFLLTIFLCLQLSKYWYADFNYGKAKTAFRENKIRDSFLYFEKALILNPEPVFYDDFASVQTFSALKLNKDKEKEEIEILMENALVNSNKALAISPNNLNFIRNRANMLTQFSNINPEYIEDSIELLVKINELAPTDAKITYTLGLMYIKAGNIDGAIEKLKEARDLKPNYKNARNVLSLLYLEIGEKENAQKEIEYILKNIDPDDPAIQERLQEINAK